MATTEHTKTESCTLCHGSGDIYRVGMIANAGEVTRLSSHVRDLHALLSDICGLICPETHPDIHSRIVAEISPCDETGFCPTLGASDRTLESAIAHWFTQGGKEEFGDIGQPQSADELISAILVAVRTKWAQRKQRQRLGFKDID